MAQATYITVAELAESFDKRLLAQLSSDTGAPAIVNESNTRLLNSIEKASSDVESAALRGQRYSTTELTALQTADDWTLKGLVAALAMGHLFSARGSTMPGHIATAVSAANDVISDLNAGRQVFNDSGAIAAGLPKLAVINRTKRAQLSMVADTQFFPSRNTRTY